MVTDKKRLQMFALAAAALVAVAILLRFSMAPEGKPPPSASGYYTGPMKGKGSNVSYGTDDGKSVPPPSQANAPTSTQAKTE